MKKAEAQGIGYLIVIGIIFIFFKWLYDTIGLIGIILIAILSIISLMYISKRRKIRYNEDFYKAIRLFLYNRVMPDETKTFSRKYMKTDFERWSLLRSLQIMHESIEIAMSSKKRETAESRMNLAQEKYYSIKSDYKDILPLDIINEMSQVNEAAINEFNSVLYKNAAKSRSLNI